MIESHINKIRKRPPYHVGGAISRIHNQLTIVDLHADSLLWNRDLLKKEHYGHTDVPRLLDGNVAIQVFGVATHFPFGVDLITLLSMFHGWPVRTWRDWFERAIYQSQKLDKFISRSAGKIRLIKSVKDLDEVLTLRKERTDRLGVLLALEGAHALNGKLSNLVKLYDSSFRVFGISHFRDNEAGSSAHGRNKAGLSVFGYELVHMLQELHMIIDLSHASWRVIDDVIEVVKSPVIVSHTGVRGTCDNSRNLTDRQVEKVAKGGGLIGIAMISRALCGKQIRDMVAAIRYVSNLVGVDFVGIGSDFDGGITAPFDASGLPLLTEELLSDGFNEGDVAKIMGGNALRVFRETLPKI
jgi:microsomal dipeptidase-like Zn-dependent dipeptidase